MRDRVFLDRAKEKLAKLGENRRMQRPPGEII